MPTFCLLFALGPMPTRHSHTRVRCGASAYKQGNVAQCLRDYTQQFKGRLSAWRHELKSSQLLDLLDGRQAVGSIQDRCFSSVKSHREVKASCRGGKPI